MLLPNSRPARSTAVTRRPADINAMDFVEAAKMRGEGRGWIIFCEVLPNVCRG